MPNDNGIKISRHYTNHHPLDNSHLTERLPDNRPDNLSPSTKIRYILRNGDKGCASAGALRWGDRPHETNAIVAYKVIKLETAWIEWGYKFDRGEELTYSHSHRIPEGLHPEAQVQVWLRSDPIPQEDIRRALDWHWRVSNESGGDIMKYRVIQPTQQ
jgi:hypothetical protein